MLQQDIESLLRDTVEDLGYVWWGCEYNAHHHRGFLRIYIDTAAGVTVDDCEKVSRQVSALLDVNDCIPGQYRLEISSPGIPRPLFYPNQYQQFIGAKVVLKLFQPLNGRRKITGEIVSADEQHLQLTTDEGLEEILFSNIAKAILAN